MDKFTIYRLTHSDSGKSYVGCTSQLLYLRMRGHLCFNGNKTYFKQELKRLGKENFSLSVLAYAESKEEAKLIERFWTRKLCTLWPQGYNTNCLDIVKVIKTRGRKKGSRLSISHRQAMSKAHTVRWAHQKGIS